MVSGQPEFKLRSAYFAVLILDNTTQDYGVWHWDKSRGGTGLWGSGYKYEKISGTTA